MGRCAFFFLVVFVKNVFFNALFVEVQLDLVVQVGFLQHLAEFA